MHYQPGLTRPGPSDGSYRLAAPVDWATLTVPTNHEVARLALSRVDTSSAISVLQSVSVRSQ
jgi:hypothetical protein